MKKWKVFLIVAALSASMFVCQAWLMSKEGFDSFHKIQTEDPFWIVLEKARIPREDADELLAADGMLFLFYEDHGVVNVYSTEGEFLRCYQVGMSQKGVGEIAYANGNLYVRSVGNDIYQFRGTELVHLDEPGKENPDWSTANRIVLKAKPKTDGGYTYAYDAVAGQITRAKPGQAPETVVQLPVKDPKVDTLIYANMVLWAFFAYWFKTGGELHGWVKEYHERKRRQLR